MFRKQSNAFFFFNDAATTEIYTLSLHDALPIFGDPPTHGAGDRHGDGHTDAGDDELAGHPAAATRGQGLDDGAAGDRKSTRLNSSHVNMSDAVFCLKKMTYSLITPIVAGALLNE